MDSNKDERDSGNEERDRIPAIQNDDDFLTLCLASPNQPTAANPPPQVLPFIHHEPVADNTLPPPQSYSFMNPPPQDFPFRNPAPQDLSTFGNILLDDYPFMDQLPPPPRVATLPSDPAFLRRRLRRISGKVPRGVKSATIPVQYPWSDVGRAAVRSLRYLREKNISRITGDVQCKKCEQKFEMQFDLEAKFGEISAYIAGNVGGMHHRAPRRWMSPALPNCRLCNQENSVRPVIAEKKRSINWLFLFLGQMLGCCTLDQLKYFCKHTKNHRTGAKDRVLFLAYLCLCKQLDPNCPFEI